MKHTLEFEVPPSWVRQVMSGELFSRAYCGYWADVIDDDHSGKRGLLVFEHNDENTPPDHHTPALRAFADWMGIPPGYYHVNSETAIDAYRHGVARWGLEWMKDADAFRYDIVMQLAILGELKYG